MGGQQEATFPRLPQFVDSVILATNSLRKITEQAVSLKSRMQYPDRDLKTENLITSKVSEKEELDRVFTLDAAMINAFLLANGRDLTDVRIHTGPFADEITHRAGADALTSGKDIYFSPGSFAPHTEEGESLLLHELEHVRQHSESQRTVYREDIDNAEREAFNREGLQGLNTEGTELFDRLKQDSLIFKDRTLTDGLDAKEKDLEDFSGTENPVIYRYCSRSGRNHEMTKEEYQTCLREIRERLTQDFRDKLMYSGEEERIEHLEKILKIFRPGGIL